MHPSLCKGLRFQLSSRVGALIYSKPQLGFLPCNEISSSSQQQQQEAIVRFFSTCSLEEKQSFAVSYLVNSCGLSLETATSVSQKVHFKTPQKPDSVLRLLRNYGFTNTHITKILRQYPRVLTSDPEKILVPKFEFLYSMGITSNAIVKIVSLNPSLLRLSLENRLIPFYNFLKNIVRGDEKAATKIFLRLGWLAFNEARKNFVPNIAVLRQLGVPESSIFVMLTCMTSVVRQNCDKFEKITKEVLDMGYDPKKTQFIQAISLFFSLSKSTREHKIEVYKRWEWSENQIRLAVKNYPIVLALSEKKIMDTMDFLVNEMGYQSADIARYPSILCFNLEKRIIPRCLVLKVLLLKGLLKKQFSLATFLQPSENRFLEKFVTGYKENTPQLLNIYQGKISLLELGFTSEEVQGVKSL